MALSSKTRAKAVGTAKTRSSLYADVLDSGKGTKIVDDLKRLFLDPPSYRVGHAHDEVIFAEGQKHVVRYILARIREGYEPPQSEAILKKEEEKG